jgi:hypothetical protein
VTVFSVTGAALFVGDGAELNETLDGIYDEAGEGALTSDAVGFSVTGASFTLALVESATDSFTGIEATDGEKVDWASATTDPAGLLPSLEITSAQDLNVVAGATLNIGGFVVVTVPLTFDGETVLTGLTLDLATADVLTGNATLGTLTAVCSSGPVAP